LPPGLYGLAIITPALFGQDEGKPASSCFTVRAANLYDLLAGCRRWAKSAVYHALLLLFNYTIQVIPVLQLSQCSKHKISAAWISFYNRLIQ
jgi:hypothetical protein